MDTTFIFHYGTIALAVALNSVAVGLGEGMTSLAALKAMNLQPHAHSEISQISIIGMAIIETAAVAGLTLSFILLMPAQPGTTLTSYSHYAELGIAFAICISGSVVGIVSSFPAQYACYAVARQPFYMQKIQGFMLLTQSFIQTPVIFSFLIGLLIKNQLVSVNSAAESLRLIGSGLCIGVGSIGPAIGVALLAKQACKSIGFNPKIHKDLLKFTLISTALIESPLIFALLVSLVLLQAGGADSLKFINGLELFSAALCMGLGTLGVGISSGKVAAQACKQIAFTPEQYPAISRTSLFAQVLIETCSIYALIVSFALIFIR
jgi:F-type H+-transporting ATPase subunit c